MGKKKIGLKEGVFRKRIAMKILLTPHADENGDDDEMI